MEGYDTDYADTRAKIHEKYPILVTYFDTDDAWIERVVAALVDRDLAADYYGAVEPIYGADEVSADDRENLLQPLTELSDELSKSNEFRAIIGDASEQIETEIKAGVTLASTDRVRKSALAAVLLKPLKLLAEKFAGGAIGALAAELIKLLLRMV